MKAADLQITLTKQEGDFLRGLISRRFNGSLRDYLENLGVQPSNWYKILSGDRRVSITLLNRLLEGIDCKMDCKTEIQIVDKKTGQDVPGVDSTEPENGLQFGEARWDTKGWPDL